MKPSARVNREPEASSHSELISWVSQYLNNKPLSGGLVVLKWQRWAGMKLSEGWTPEACKEYIREKWRQWAYERNIDDTPLEPELSQALAECASFAYQEGSPAQCAEIYRTLDRKWPGHEFLNRYVNEWSQKGEHWLDGGPPPARALRERWRLTMEQRIRDIREAQAQIEAAAKVGQ